jgi:hypothetical protein
MKKPIFESNSTGDQVKAGLTSYFGSLATMVGGGYTLIMSNAHMTDTPALGVSMFFGGIATALVGPVLSSKLAGDYFNAETGAHQGALCAVATPVVALLAAAALDAHEGDVSDTSLGQNSKIEQVVSHQALNPDIIKANGQYFTFS